MRFPRPFRPLQMGGMSSRTSKLRGVVRLLVSGIWCGRRLPLCMEPHLSECCFFFLLGSAMCCTTRLSLVFSRKPPLLCFTRWVSFSREDGREKGCWSSCQRGAASRPFPVFRCPLCLLRRCVFLLSIFFVLVVVKRPFGYRYTSKSRF